MTDERLTSDESVGDEEGSQEPLERIEEAREEAAAYVVQREPLDPGSDVGDAEERILDALEEARTEQDADELAGLADEAEEARDDIRRELYGRGSVEGESDRG